MLRQAKSTVCVSVCLLQAAALSDLSQSCLVEEVQLCVHHGGSSWVLVLSKCVMMAVYSVKGMRDNIQLLTEMLKDRIPTRQHS